MRINGGRSRRVHWVVLAVLGAALLGHALLYDYVVDDAFISFRYARNLVNGHGPVYNPGEKVEGYTNFLWVVLAALGMRAGADPVPLSQGLGLLLALGVVALAYGWPRPGERNGKSLRLLSPTLLALSPPFALWSMGGLETPLFALLVLAGMAAGVRVAPRWDVVSGLCLALAALTRPEGILAGLVVVGDRLLWPPSAGRVRDRVPLGLIAVWLAVLVPYEIWRVLYYGDLLPNSFYAKVGWSGAQVWRGVQYLGGFTAASGGLALSLAAVGLADGLRDRSARVLYLWTGLYLAYVVAVGGDGLGMYRFFVPALAPLYLLVERGFAVLGRVHLPVSAGWRRVLGLGILTVLAASTVRATIASEEKAFVARDRIFVEKHWTAIGLWLREYAEPDESIAVTTAGAVPYYSGLYTIDMLGINEPAIARRQVENMGRGIAGHEKHDMEYVLARRPTYLFHHLFLLTRPKVTPEQFVTPWNPGEEDLLTSETFARFYERVSEKVGPFYINFFRLREVSR